MVWGRRIFLFRECNLENAVGHSLKAGKASKGYMVRRKTNLVGAQPMIREAYDRFGLRNFCGITTGFIFKVVVLSFTKNLTARSTSMRDTSVSHRESISR